MAVNDQYYQQKGWVKVGDGWVPPDHPLAQNQPPTMSTEQGGGYQAAPGYQAPASGFAGIPQQAQNAATYSNTPGASPTPYNTNQGTQDTVRNSYLQRATQPATVDRTAPEYRQQADVFAAGQDRSRRQYESETAERLSAKGLGSSGAMDIERRMAAERSGTNQAQFEAQLVGRELENIRNEKREALSALQGMLSVDQEAALRRELADLDAELKRLGITTSASTAASDLALRDKLGTGALNVDLMRALLANQQWAGDSALRWADFDWRTGPGLVF